MQSLHVSTKGTDAFVYGWLCSGCVGLHRNVGYIGQALTYN